MKLSLKIKKKKEKEKIDLMNDSNEIGSDFGIGNGVSCGSLIQSNT